MKRALPSLVVAALAACGPTEAPRSEAPPAEDSSVVVASGPEVPPDDTPVVVFLGTSLTAGFGLERDADGYVARLEALADSAGLPFRAVNAGVSGETSAGGLRRLDWALRSPFDVLFLELGANDGLRGQDPGALEANLREIVAKARARYADARIVVAGMEAPPNLGPSYTSAFREVFPRVAADTDAALVPFLLDGVAGVPTLNQGDRIHPTAEGHRIVARNVWPVLEAVLREVEG